MPAWDNESTVALFFIVRSGLTVNYQVSPTSEMFFHKPLFHFAPTLVTGVSVCLSAGISQKRHVHILHRIFCAVYTWSSSQTHDDTGERYTSGFVDDVMFSHDIPQA